MVRVFEGVSVYVMFIDICSSFPDKNWKKGYYEYRVHERDFETVFYLAVTILPGMKRCMIEQIH